MPEECQEEFQSTCQIECQNIYAIYMSTWYVICQKPCQNSVSGWRSLEVRYFLFFFSRSLQSIQRPMKIAWFEMSCWMICWWISMRRYWAKGLIILKLRGFPCSLACRTLTLPRCQDANDLPPAFQAKQNEEIGVQHLGSGRKVDIQVASYQNPRIYHNQSV